MTLKATNISTGDYKKEPTSKYRYWIGLGLLGYFLGLAFLSGPEVWNDSAQYLAMHIHREPLYCFLLHILQVLFVAENAYLYAAAVVQGVLAAVSIWWMAEALREQFHLNVWEEAITAVIALFPFVITRYFSAMHINLSNSIMSEGLCIPLFYLFLTYTWKMAWEQKRKDYVWALLFALLASLTRGQMMITILVWLVVAVYLELLVKRSALSTLLRNSMLLCACVAFVFVARTNLIKTYNLVYNDHFITNTYGKVSLFTNVMYASDKEDAQYITSEENRAFYMQMMDRAYENEATHTFYGTSLSERAQGIEDCHDFLKFECIEKVLYEYYDNNVTTDYIEQNLMEDQVASELMHDLLPHVWKEWLLNYMGVVYRGLVRSVAMVHPLLNLPALLLIVISIIVTIWLAVKNPANKVMLTLGVALLSLGANAFACAITIMCLSRYMVYGFAGFYIGWGLLIRERFRKSSKK